MLHPIIVQIVSFIYYVYQFKINDKNIKKYIYMNSDKSAYNYLKHIVCYTLCNDWDNDYI